ncbi:thiol-disulfide oxidoreductase DCC family protein [Alkalihalobacillus sp. MEB130]|uniref:thiol-disulfide oxidoreductase DCC family protein n=1 Tax=Alkalihalobacillus sp. MEB130 TaxID=2976704 RepID=UPI0028DF3943|nr:thiol-disulfide oxidoreductase DCC family protein [Alkalihalobacillus sp. MEB130]MDT8861625.1 thiol-disulfide oxidoreductase DCC family protein [Alkalihalobacillus sp. MEB130]
MEPIILFDGDCRFCDRSVQFIIKRDKKGVFKFASLQSDIGQRLLAQYGVSDHVNSLVLLQDDFYYLKSTAALKITHRLRWPWNLFVILRLVPAFLRNKTYDVIANNRYHWFGTNDHCRIPPPHIRRRFLD